MIARTFDRYFPKKGYTARRGGGSMFGSFFGGSRGDRNAVSEILENLVYLSNLPKDDPFANDATEALVVSCLDIDELAASNLLLEPLARRVKYHVLAMEDRTASTGSAEQIVDTLVLMSEFADQNKPIRIHCREGVGRSAMITALHIAVRYLLGDAKVTAAVSATPGFKALDPENTVFIRELYDAAARFVLSKRTCCQFNDYGRLMLAIEVLSAIHARLKENKPLSDQADDSYRFMAELVQTAEFKKILHFYHRKPVVDDSTLIHNVLQGLLFNNDDWCENLDSVHEKKLYGTTECRQLLKDLYGTLVGLSSRYPESEHGKHIEFYQLKNLCSLFDDKNTAKPW